MKQKTLVTLSLITLAASFTLAAHAQTFSVIHSFQGPEGDDPTAGVSLRGGVIYGTADNGGKSCGQGHSCGTVYQITPVGSNWITRAIFLFPTSGNGAGWSPGSRVVFGPDGHFYGTTGNSLNGGGVVYRLTPPPLICKTAGCLWTANELHTFTGGSDGIDPGLGDLIWDQQGNIYGTTGLGGTQGENGCGTVFQMTGSGSNWTETPIYSFTESTDGCYPAGGVVMDSNGNLFGTTSSWGGDFLGTVYELSYDPQAGWKETTLYTFTGGIDGGYPQAGLILDSSGNLYGATFQGSASSGPAVFELSPSGNTWTFKVLYQFSIATKGPYASLTLDAAGNLYGTTYEGGAFNYGTVFRLANTGNGWVYTSLHDFTGGDDGRYPFSNVTIDTDGTLYGTASQGGVGNNGVVWMIKP